MSLVLLVSSCGSDSDDTTNPGGTTSAGGTTTSTPADAPQPGGEITLFWHNDNGNLDTTYNDSSPANDSAKFIAIYDTLVRVGKDGSIVPRLAESLETSDSTTWTLTLRAGLTFTDGTPLDAEAVKFNWERHLDPDSASRCLSSANRIDNLTVVSAVELKVVLKQPFAPFARLLEQCMGLIGSPTAIEALGDQFAVRPVAAGPFKVAEYIKDDHLTLERNEDFWDAPRPYLDKIIVRPVPTISTRLQSVEQTGNSVGFDFGSPELGRLRDAGYELVYGDLMGGAGFAFNTTRPPFDDVRARRALVQAIRPGPIVQKAIGDVGQPVDTLFPEDSVFYEPIEYPFDALAEGQALLDEYLADVGQTSLSLSFLAGGTVPFAEAIHQDISRLQGVDITLNVVDSAQYLRLTADGDFDLTIIGFNDADPEPLFSNRVGTGGTANYGKYSNPELDDLLAQGLAAADVTARAAIYKSVQELLTEELPVVPIHRSRYFYVPGKDVRGLTSDVMFGKGYWDPTVIWLEQ